MNNKNLTVDAYLSKAKKWRREMEGLRTILLRCGLTEELKWGKPCYLFENSNIVIIQAFKEYVALGFFKGCLLNDSSKILIAPGVNSQTMRQIRFTNVKKIVAMEPTIKASVYEAVEVETAGLKVNIKKNTSLIFPEEFQKKLDGAPALKEAFESLSPGRQRGYNIYFSQPKQSKTREARVEKYMQQILNRKGLNDR
ncbi:MAG: YdeI/OmpD-associated family protein [Ignavibacteriaceae bacterium]|nr:YdeI/OmpD-associated family protein [Ignavibacteriaceae bacterium]